MLSAIEQEFGWEGRRHQTYQALRAVLHALRDRLPIHDSANFAAQLPLLVKGIYYDGWRSESVPIKMDKQEFIDRVSHDFVFDIDDSMENLIKRVIGNVFAIIDPGETQKILRTLPAEIADLLRQ